MEVKRITKSRKCLCYMQINLYNETNNYNINNI